MSQHPSSATPGYPCTVLLVDRDETMSAATMTLLEADGCTVLPVQTLDTAVRLLDLIVAAVVLVDPFGAAPDTPLESLAPVLEKATGVPVLLFTARSVDEAAARRAGFSGVVPKPYEAERLLAAVREAAREAAAYSGPPRRAPHTFC